MKGPDHPHVRDLVRCHAPELFARIGPGAPISSLESCQYVEQRGLSCTVRADHPGDDPFFDLQMIHIYGQEAAERLGYLVHHQDGVALGRPRLRWDCGELFFGLRHRAAAPGGLQGFPEDGRLSTASA